MKMKLFIVVFIASFTSTVAIAESYVGVPKGAHFNGVVAGRGICVQLSAPTPLPLGSQWFCNYSAGNSTYNEINTTLMEASFRKTSCGITSTSLGPGSFHKIESVSCPNFNALP